MKLLLQTALFVLTLISTVFCSSQRISVRGKLLCGTKPAGGIRIKLYDYDFGPDPDDLMAQGYTEANGEFELSGQSDEFTPIDPVFKVYHDCDDNLPCQRKWKLWIPDKYINGDTMYMGTLNLETRMKDEDRDCFWR